MHLTNEQCRNINSLSPVVPNIQTNIKESEGSGFELINGSDFAQCTCPTKYPLFLLGGGWVGFVPTIPQFQMAFFFSFFFNEGISVVFYPTRVIPGDTRLPALHTRGPGKARVGN